MRAQLGPEIELIHDIHDRLKPADAVRFAKELEPVRLFFLEDALAPEDIEWFANIRAASAGRWPWASCSCTRANGCRSSRGG